MFLRKFTEFFFTVYSWQRLYTDAVHGAQLAAGSGISGTQPSMEQAVEYQGGMGLGEGGGECMPYPAGNYPSGLPSFRQTTRPCPALPRFRAACVPISKSWHSGRKEGRTG